MSRQQKQGQKVEVGDVLCSIEAMDRGTAIKPSDQIHPKDLLMLLE